MNCFVVLDGLDAFSTELEKQGHKVVRTVASSVPIFDKHEDYEKWATSSGTLETIVENIGEETIFLAMKPTTVSGISLVFIDLLKRAGKKVNVVLMGKMRSGLSIERFLFRTLFGIFKEKSISGGLDGFFVFSYDLFSKYIRVPLLEQEEKYQGVVAELLMSRIFFSESLPTGSFSGEFSGTISDFESIKTLCGVSVLSKIPLDRLGAFETDCVEVFSQINATPLGNQCSILEENVYVSDPKPKMKEAIEEFIYGKNTSLTNVYVHSKNKEDYVLEMFIF